MSRSYVIFSALFAPHIGGVETFTSNLAHELTARGDAVTVVTCRIDGSPESEARADGVCVVRLPALPLMGGRLPITRGGSRTRQLLDQVARAGVDRVLVNTRFYAHSIVGLDFAARVGAPAVVLDHGSAYLTFGSAALDVAAHRYEHLMTRRCLRRKPSFAGISEKSAQWLSTFGVATDLVIPNALDAAAFRASSSGRDFRGELGVSVGDKLVAFIGRLAPEKGPDILVEVAGIVGEGVHFALAGDGPMRAELEDGLPANVHLLGNVPHEDASALLAQADAFCLPTRSEGFCTSLLEAGAWGVPCVVPDVGGAREVVCSGDESFGVVTSGRTPQEMAAALQQVLAAADDGRFSRMRDHVESDHSWGKTVERLDEAFGDVARIH